MITIAIPRFFPCRRRYGALGKLTELLCIDSPLSEGHNALTLFSTRRRAQEFIDRSEGALSDWGVGYIGYDLMPMWLRSARDRHGADAIVIDMLADGYSPTCVVELDDVLAALSASDSESGDDLPVEACMHTL